MFRFYSHNILRDKGESWFTVNSKLLVADAERKKWQKLISKLWKMLTIMLLSVFDDDEAWENLFLVFDLIQKLVTFLIEDDSLPYCYISVGSFLPIWKYWRWKVVGGETRGCSASLWAATKVMRAVGFPSDWHTLFLSLSVLPLRIFTTSMGSNSGFPDICHCAMGRK